MEDYIDKDKGPYTPSSLINVFSNNLNVHAAIDTFEIEGVYINQNLKEYDGYYYDKIKEIHSDQKITLVIPKKIKEVLISNFIYLFSGYLTKKITVEGYIQLNFKVTQLLSHEGKSNNDSFNETKAIAIKNNKTLKEYKNFRLFVEEKLLNAQKPRFALIIGDNAIIKDDIFNALGEYKKCYIIEEHKTNLSSVEDIISKLKEADDGRYESIIISGSGLEIFDKIEILQAVNNLNSMLVTAIGHAVDITFLQSIADYNFDTPTALGSFLKETAEKVNRIINDRISEVDNLNTTINLMKEEYKKSNELSVSENINKLEEKNMQIARIKKHFAITVTVLVVLFILYKLIFK